ncbi:sarcosine oxidase subunit gamma [Ruegeria sp. 2012CJ41-6]|uniref:Sarcosine oxidase subunit gamma n=1 Tax=Ruegeria spongiae TaxID=2942209 RepID=A0ABT0Q4G7_9RHOB|nr:sarcosine oxidase subunit gamma [Ruegeria spongiae]MCL6284756.1 sarcosine oxidase subunit gamma [Ruegeria spongiae]
MVELLATSPCEGLLPLCIGQVTLREEEVGHLTSLAPYRGQSDALSQTLHSAHGVAFPAPNRVTGKAGARAIWFGRDQALLMGPEPDQSLRAHAAIADLSDGWAAVRLEGDGAEDVLARLVPVDLRREHFKRGHTIRSQIFHLNASISRVDDNGFVMLVFRSMAASLVHDLKTAMEGVAARG